MKNERFLTLLVLCVFGFLAASASFAGAETAAVDTTAKASPASDQKQAASTTAQNVLVSKEIVTESSKKKEKTGKAKESGDPKPATIPSSNTAEPVKMVMRTVSGQVSAKSSTGIAVVYERDEEKRSSKEYWFPFEEEIKLLGYRTLQDIQERDTVTVAFEEAEDGSQRTLKRIALSKKAPREIEERPENEEQPAAEASLQSGGEET